MSQDASAPEFRLPSETRLGAVRLQVADLDRSVRWYGDVLGLRVLDTRDGEARLAAHDDDAVLVELRARAGAAPVPRQGRLGLYHFAVLLPERASLGRFVAHLSAIGQAAGAADHLVSEALYLHDPDGLGIEVYADRPRSSWQRRGGQLVMDTLPLDFSDLVRAGGDAAWQGMPPGASIGHVHLHVGQLAAAAAFYGDALGFERTVWSYPGALFLSAGGYHHHLGVNTWAAGAPPAGEGEARLIEWQIVLPTAASVHLAGARLAEAGHDTQTDGDTVVARDPWGTALRLR